MCLVGSALRGTKGARVTEAKGSAETRADVVIVGLGVIGLSTALALARRGHSVVGIDRLCSGHPATSSTGPSRSIRLAYEQPLYVELAREAIDRWRALERDVDDRILLLTGQLDLGPAAKLDGLAAGMRACDAPFEELDADGVVARFPELRPRSGEHALFHADAGTVLADTAMDALRRQAEAAGAALSAPEAAVTLDIAGPDAAVVTDRRTIRASTVVVSAGPWLGGLLTGIGIDLPLAPAVAQVSFVGLPSLDGRCGIADWEIDEHGVGVYGHPVPDVGYKVAFDAGSADPWNPDTEEWTPDPAEAEALARWVASRMPDATSHLVRHQRHPWTMTPDGDFVIDRRGPLVIAGGCAGHAFKFGPALGALVADLVENHPRSGTELFALDRPALTSARAEATAPIVR
jgi:sarcosine oxidase